VVIANIVAYLQSVKESPAAVREKGRKALYEIFDSENLESAMGDIMLRQPWDAPDGTGEFCIVDNRTTLHASYHSPRKDYAIGARYLY
jgi:alpha-ketoglutarate-dependent taurine dioxygenase